MVKATQAHKTAVYDNTSIEAFEGLEGVRIRPGMYIGENDKRGIVHLLKEVVGNAVDEATNGHGKVIKIAFNKDGSLVVADEGRGIPVGPFVKDKTRDTLTVIFTVMHSGGKFDKGKENYAAGRIGTHGVGLGVVNALSTKLEVWSWRNQVWNYQPFEKGIPKTSKPVAAKKLPNDLGFIPNNAGTVLRFTPDLSCFSRGSKFDPDLALEWIDDIGWLIGDVRLEIYQGNNNKPTIIHRPNGLQDRFKHELTKLGAEALAEPLIYHSPALDLLVGWTDQSEEITYSAVGSVRTAEGGTHVKGLEAAITAAFATIAGKRATEYKNEYLRTGLVAVVNIKMDEPKFNSQDKVKLISDEAKEVVLAELAGPTGAIVAYLKAHRELANGVLARAIEFTKLNDNFKASKKLAAAYKVEGKGKINLPKALKASTTDVANDRELYLVEGASAGGSGGKARDAEYQEVYPLSGKIKNVWRADVEKSMFSERIIEVMQCIGYNPDLPGSYRVGKVILLTDADDDGSHIAALLLGLVQRVCPDLLAQGRVFIANAPLYLYRAERGNVYGENLGHLMQQVKQEYPRHAFDNRSVTRIKGWGEINPETLRPIAFDPTTRKLTRVQPATGPQIQRVIDFLGEDVAARKLLLGLGG